MENSPKKLCIACQAEIPTKATICSHCSTKQDRRLNFLQNLGAIIGILSAILAFTAYVISSVPTVRKTLWWKDDINVLSYSDQHVVIGNNGDGDVFISHVLIERDSPRHTHNTPIKRTISSGEILDFTANLFTVSAPGWTIVSGTSDSEWQAYLGQEGNLQSTTGPCTYMVYYSQTDPDFQMYTSYLESQLRKVEAKATIFYFSNKSGQEMSETFPVYGILHKNETSCSQLVTDLIASQK